MVEQRPADRRHHVVIEHFVEIDKPWNPGAVLGQCEGNVAEAARRMRLSRMTLYRKLRKWSISRLEILGAAHR